MSNPQVFIEGPLDDSGSVQGPTTPLTLVEEAEVSTDTDTNSQTVPGFDAGETIQSPLEASRDYPYSGFFNPFVTQREGYGSNPLPAVRSYLFELESFVIPEQKKGYLLVDNENDVTRNPNTDVGVLVEEVEWEISGGDGLRGEFRVESVRGEGFQNTERVERSDYISDQSARQVSNPSTVLSFDGIELDLGYLDDMSVLRSIDIQASKLLHNFDVPEVGVIESGVTEEVTLSGTVTEEVMNRTLEEWVERINFDAHGVRSTLEESFTGRQYTGTLSTSSTTKQSGRPRGVDFELEFETGNAELFDNS